MSKVYSLAELQSIFTPVFSEHGARKAVLFGSYAKGTAAEHSSLVEREIQNSGVAIYGQ